MRRFGPVKESKACDSCGIVVAVSQEEITRQCVITYDGSSLVFTYCSNKCVNADYERSSEAAENQSHYWAHIIATYEDEERMIAAHLAAFIEDEERSNMPNTQTTTQDTDNYADGVLASVMDDRWDAEVYDLDWTKVDQYAEDHENEEI